jgi:uncharacterized protein (DUF934 family)
LINDHITELTRSERESVGVRLDPGNLSLKRLARLKNVDLLSLFFAALTNGWASGLSDSIYI